LSSVPALSAGRHYGAQRQTSKLGRFTLTETHYAPGQSTPWHLHEAPALCLVTHGGYVERFRQGQVVCRASSVVFRPARAEHSDLIGEGGASAMIVEPELGWLAELGIDAQTPLHRPQARREGLLLRQAREEFRVGDAISRIAVEALLLATIVHLLRGALRTAAHPLPRWLLGVRATLDARYLERITLAGLALDAGVHPVHLAASFRRAFGATIGDYVRTRRVEHAQRTLRECDRGTSRIALECGFANASHFARVFAKHTGMQPRAYRRLHRES
jgi:AraC family transcriptional regulator